MRQGFPVQHAAGTFQAFVDLLMLVGVASNSTTLAEQTLLGVVGIDHGHDWLLEAAPTSSRGGAAPIMSCVVIDTSAFGLPSRASRSTGGRRRPSRRSPTCCSPNVTVPMRRRKLRYARSFFSNSSSWKY